MLHLARIPHKQIPSMQLGINVLIIFIERCCLRNLYTFLDRQSSKDLTPAPSMASEFPAEGAKEQVEGATVVHHYLDNKGVKIHYVETGKSSGQPVLLLHGEVFQPKRKNRFIGSQNGDTVLVLTTDQ